MTTTEILDHVPISDLLTPPANDEIYGQIKDDDPDVLALADSIRRDGILEPLVVSKDNWVISGNRRLTAARIAGLESVPVRRVDVKSSDHEFIRLIVEHNAQRVKTIDQQARELAVTIDPATAWHRLVETRIRESFVDPEELDLGEIRCRCKIKGNRPLADACIRIVTEMRQYWPLSDRQIHYLLLNDPPHLHEKKKTRYQNDKRSYRTLTNVLTRLRIAGEIQFAAISDETRPINTWNTHAHPQAYLRKQLKYFLQDYWRDLLQSQPNHVELLVEKLTVQNIVKAIAMDLTVPLTVGRGFSSLPPRYEMVQRFIKSGKSKMIVVIVSDMDPAGMTIAESIGRSLRDDFGVDENRLVCTKAALTLEQVEQLGLPAAMEAKRSSTSAEYVRRYGKNVWELEAVPPAALQKLVKDALLGVLDIIKLNQEQEREVTEAAELAGYRKAVLQIFEHGQEC